MLRGDKEGGESLERLLGEIAGGRVRPCYLIWGDEDFLVKKAKEALVAALLDESDRALNLFERDGEKTDFAALQEDLLTSPLLPSRKVVVLSNTPFLLGKGNAADLITGIKGSLDSDPPRAARAFLSLLALMGWRLEDMRDGGWQRIDDAEWGRLSPGSGADDREKWLPRVLQICLDHGLTETQGGDGGDRLASLLLAGLPEGHVLILTAPAVDRRKRLFKAVSQLGAVLNYTRPKGEERQRSRLAQEARRVLEGAGKTMTDAAWLALGRKTGFDLAASLAAVEKLVLYTEGRPLIDEGDVEEVVGKTKEDHVFALMAALSARDLDRAVRVVNDLCDRGTAPLLILSMLAREIRLLLHGKLILESGVLGDYNPALDFAAFQARLYARIKALGTPEGAGGPPLEFALQHPFVIYNALRNSVRFTKEDLLQRLEALCAMDAAMKGGAADPRLLLERFLIRFS